MHQFKHSKFSYSVYNTVTFKRILKIKTAFRKEQTNMKNKMPNVTSCDEIAITKKARDNTLARNL